MLKNNNIGYSSFFQIIIEYYKRVHLLWAVAGHEMSTLTIQAQSFNCYLISQVFTNFVNIRRSFFIQVHNSLTVHDSLWTLKLDNFSEFQNVIRVV